MASWASSSCSMIHDVHLFKTWRCLTHKHPQVLMLHPAKWRAQKWADWRQRWWKRLVNLCFVLFFLAEVVSKGRSCKCVHCIRELTFIENIKKMNRHFLPFFMKVMNCNDCTFFNQGTVLYACSFNESSNLIRDCERCTKVNYRKHWRNAVHWCLYSLGNTNTSVTKDVKSARFHLCDTSVKYCEG